MKKLLKVGGLVVVVAIFIFNVGVKGVGAQATQTCPRVFVYPGPSVVSLDRCEINLEMVDGAGSVGFSVTMTDSNRAAFGGTGFGVYSLNDFPSSGLTADVSSGSFGESYKINFSLNDYVLSSNGTEPKVYSGTVKIILNNGGGIVNDQILPLKVTVKVYPAGTKITPISTEPSVKVISPNGSEHYNVGEIIPIVVQTSNLPPRTKVQVSLLQGTGSTFLSALNDAAYAVGDTWTFNYKAEENKQVPLKVSAVLWGSSEVYIKNYSDSSDDYFYIGTAVPIPKPKITLKSPNGGENWSQEDSHTITWTSTGIENGNTISVSVNDDTGKKCILPVWINHPTSEVSFYPSRTSCSKGSTLLNLKAGGKYKVGLEARVYDGPESLVLYDESDNYFTIPPLGTLTITSPNGGEKYNIGDQVSVKWSSVGGDSQEKIKLGIYQGVKGLLFADIPNTGSYQWNIPKIVSSIIPGDSKSLDLTSQTGPVYRILISNASSTITDLSNATFSILANGTTTPPGIVPCFNFTKELKTGSTDSNGSKDVANLQSYLGMPSSGYFGDNTYKTLIQYQKKNRLEDTGVLDYNTRAQINGSCPAAKKAVSVSGLTSIVTPISGGQYGNIIGAGITFKFTVHNTGNSDVYISKVPATALATSTSGSVGSPAAGSSTLTYVQADQDTYAQDTGTAPTSGAYVVLAGVSRTFTYTGVLYNTNGTNGNRVFRITQINYGKTAANPTGQSITSGLVNLTVVQNLVGQSNSPRPQSIPIYTPPASIQAPKTTQQNLTSAVFDWFLSFFR